LGALRALMRARDFAAVRNRVELEVLGFA